MSGAYRSGPEELPPREEDVRWRYSVGRAAHFLYWSLIAQYLLAPLVALIFHVYEGNLLSLLYLTLAGIAAWFGWRLTRARPREANVRRLCLRWTLRGLAIASPLFLLLEWLDLADYSSLVWQFAAGALPIAGLLYMRELFIESEKQAPARRSVKLAISYGLITMLLCFFSLFMIDDEYRSFSLLLLLRGVAQLGLLVVLLLAARLFSDLNRTLRVLRHEWWYKEATGWASLVYCADKRVEVIQPSGDYAIFEGYVQGCRWLEQNGFLAEDRALSERLVLAAPPKIKLAGRAAGTATA